MDRLYGWKLNPVYHSGGLVAALLVVLLVTGLYLIFFYRIGEPHASVARITDQAWLGRWIRTLHRYAADAAVVAAAVHGFRMFAQGRSWGARALAWISGGVLVFLLFVCGWTGYVMVWDGQAHLLAVEGARFLDALPLFSEPIGRTFVGEQPLPGAFFFLNLFLHIAVPVGMGVVLWLHVSRVARPALWPPRRLTWGVVALLTAAAVAWPVGAGEAADLLRVPGRVVFDYLYGFWLPVSRHLSAGAVWGVGGLLGLAFLLVPWWSRPEPGARPAPSAVDERLCTGCEQCYLDCPYEAIDMSAREDGRAELVAVVDPDLCVSCGICAGSCAPMGVGPPGRTGRDQLDDLDLFLADAEPDPDGVVVVGCEQGGAGGGGHRASAELLVSCAGNLHTSVVELLVRAGWGGVLVVACPPRDCWSREGPAWLEARMYGDREAELRERVDRRRVRLVHAAAGRPGTVADAVRAFRADVRALRAPEAETEIELDESCDPAGVGETAP